MEFMYKTRDGSDEAELNDDRIRDLSDNHCEVLVARENELFLDIDDPMTTEELADRMVSVEDKLGIKLELNRVTPSQSGGCHKHVILFTDRKLPELHKIIIQLCLGSSPKRELHNLRRAHNGITPNNVLIEGPWKHIHPEGDSNV